jgi:hypothetical protein
MVRSCSVDVVVKCNQHATNHSFCLSISKIDYFYEPNSLLFKEKDTHSAPFIPCRFHPKTAKT